MSAARRSSGASRQRLAGKAAFLAGATSGIGAATARIFASEGASVAVAGRRIAEGEAVAAAIVDAGGEAIFVKTDVTDPASVEQAIKAATDKFRRLDVLFNNAGGSTPQDGRVTEAPIEEFWRAIRLDLFGTWNCCRFGIPELVRAGGGSVINMASNVALMGVAGRDCYTAAKGGVAAITRSMAVEFAPLADFRGQIEIGAKEGAA